MNLENRGTINTETEKCTSTLSTAPCGQLLKTGEMIWDAIWIYTDRDMNPELKRETDYTESPPAK